MWKKLKSRGAETVEYAIVLACIAAFGLMFSDNLTHTLETLMGKTGSIITNGTTNKGDKDDETGKDDNNNQEDEQDKNLVWIEKLMQASKEQKFGAYLNTIIEEKRKDPNFKDNDGLIDSEANSDFVKFMEKTLETQKNIPGCSWVFAGYTKDGQRYYNVSIYNPENNVDNGKKSLNELSKNDKIKTDVYVVDAGGKVVSKTNVEQKVAERTDKNGNKYNVIRDSDYKDKP